MTKYSASSSRSLSTRSSLVSQSYSNNLFGTIARGNLLFGNARDFIPLNGEGDVLNLRNGYASASWLGLASKNMQYWAYQYCAPLAGVIDRLAEADTNGKIEFQNEDGTTVKNPSKNPTLNRIRRLLKKPNPTQTWHEFNSQQIVLCKIFGYCPVFAITPVGMDKSYAKSLWNINPFFATPSRNDEFDMFTDENNPIKSWTLSIFGRNYTIDSSDILLIKDGYLDNTITQDGLPLSKIAGLDYFVSNICAALEADNVLLKKKGPLGIFSYNPRTDNVAGFTPMTPGQQKEVQDDLTKYGLTLGQLQYVVSKIPIKWDSMSFNLQELMTKETVRQGIEGICDRLGFPAELMSGKNATYENRNSAEKFLYQNNIIPFTLRRMERYDQFFGLENISIVMDYDHLPVLQEDIMKAGTARKAQSDSIKSDWETGLITWNEARVLMDHDTVSGMDIYYPEWIKNNPPAQQKANSPLNIAA